MSYIDVKTASSNLVWSVVESLAAMARQSSRAQADLDAALRRSKITLTSEQQEAILEMLLDSGDIERLIPLRDGGILLTVTDKGLHRN